MKRLLTAFLVLGATAARAEDPGDQVLVAVQIELGGKQIAGVSHTMEWSLAALDRETTRVRLSVPLASFDSGHPRIDALMRKAADCANHPAVELDGVVREGRFSGTLTLHGVSRSLEIPVGLHRAGEQVVASASFAVDLRDFGIWLPQVDHRVSIDFTALLRAHPGAVIGGGAIRS